MDHLRNEVFILSSLSNPFLVEMKGITQDNKFLYIGMEFVQGGELFTYHRKMGKFPKIQTAFYAAQVVSMFEYLHSFNVIYRDLKPENLLIGSDGYLKLADFGFAKIVKSRTYTLCGTPEYIAPEILLNKGHGKGVDWWTLGILIYEMIAGMDPFNADEPMRIYQKIIRGKIKFSRSFDSDAKSLVKHLLTADLSKRYGNLKGASQDIKYHRFFDQINWRKLQKKQIVPPYKPQLRSIDDTGNFNFMGNSSTSFTKPVSPQQDPFLEW